MISNISLPSAVISQGHTRDSELREAGSAGDCPSGTPSHQRTAGSPLTPDTREPVSRFLPPCTAGTGGEGGKEGGYYRLCVCVSVCPPFFSITTAASSFNGYV